MWGWILSRNLSHICNIKSLVKSAYVTYSSAFLSLSFSALTQRFTAGRFVTIWKLPCPALRLDSTVRELTDWYPVAYLHNERYQAEIRTTWQNIPTHTKPTLPRNTLMWPRDGNHVRVTHLMRAIRQWERMCSQRLPATRSQHCDL